MYYFWKIVGAALLLWVGWDLYAGYTYAWDIIYRDSNPTTYWGVLGLWALAGGSCFIQWGNGNE